jgi:hypothetical protein
MLGSDIQGMLAARFILATSLHIYTVCTGLAVHSITWSALPGIEGRYKRSPGVLYTYASPRPADFQRSASVAPARRWGAA